MNQRAFLFLSGIILFSAGMIMMVYNKEVVQKWISWRKGLYGESNIRAYDLKMVKLNIASGSISMSGFGLVSIASALENTHLLYFSLAITIGSVIASMVASWFVVKRK